MCTKYTVVFLPRGGNEASGEVHRISRLEYINILFCTQEIVDGDVRLERCIAV